MSKNFKSGGYVRSNRLRASRKSSTLSNDSSLTTELEGDDSAMATHINASNSRRSVSSSRYFQSKLSPSLAAAMLSLPWPPPPKQINSEKEKVESGGAEEDTETDNNKVNASKSKSKPTNARKFYRKRRSKQTPIPDRENNNEEREYVPLTIPKFKEVHTDWPGFNHEPIPNWQQKYMIAKPYPKKLEELPKEILSKPSYGSHCQYSSVSPSESEEDLDMKSRSQSKTKQGQGKATDQGSGSKPRRRLYVERIGSCMK